MAPLQFHFDFISPFGYFASLRIEDIAARHGRTVEWRPMLLGVSVLKVMGLKPLLQTPLKGDYLRREIARYQRRHGLALARRPDDPMMDPRACARAFYWTLAHRPDVATALAQRLYERYWARGEDLSTAERVVAGELPEGLDPHALQAGIASEDTGQRLRAAVESSMKAGVFGSPTVIADGELFWGVESLHTLEEWLVAGGW